MHVEVRSDRGIRIFPEYGVGGGGGGAQTSTGNATLSKYNAVYINDSICDGGGAGEDLSREERCLVT